MASTLESFQDLNLTKDEVERIGEALKDKEFRKLLTDYVEEIRDPENRKLYEKEVTQLEKERGMDVKFINPIPGYVIKTSANGTQKAFINVACNDHVGRPTSMPTYQEGLRGAQWSLPHTLSPPREDYDSKRLRCLVYDVVFHPETLKMAKNSKQFKNLVNSTSCESVEKNFNVKLDQKNLKFPNLQYKGADHPSIIRTPSKTTQSPKSDDEQKFLDELFARLPPPLNNNQSPQKNSQNSKNSSKSTGTIIDDSHSKYTTPKYVIKHRSLVDMQEYTYDRDAKENIAIPRELIVEVFLPMLRSSVGVTLDVTEKTIQLISETPAKYKLNLTLPYAVNQELGNAKFEKDGKKLVITLPVIRNKHFLITDVNSIDDSGVESDHGSPTLSDNLIEELKENGKPLNDNFTAKSVFQQGSYDFFDTSIDYTLPEHVCQTEKKNCLNFTFKVKNVNCSSIEQQMVGNNTLLMKFMSISTGFFPINYGIIIQLSEGIIDEDDLEIEAWDNNVIALISVVQTNAIKSYFYGSKQDQLIEAFLDNKTLIMSTNWEEKKAEICVKNDQETMQCEDNSLGTEFSETVSKKSEKKEKNHKDYQEVKINDVIDANVNKRDLKESKNDTDLINLELANSEHINSRFSVNYYNTSESENNIEEDSSIKLQNKFANVEKNIINIAKSDNLQEKFNKTSTNHIETLENPLTNKNLIFKNNISNEQFSANFKLKQSQAVDISRNIKAVSGTASSHYSSSPSSSCDEHSSSCGYSCSPVKNMNRCKGILKQRMRVTRSISESGLDDAVCCMGGIMEIDSCCHSVEEEGVIPEEDVALTVCVGNTKKTVRFSENISQQLFRSNSSILGQKKKNQRKARNKKRAQERRHSESEICDTSSSTGNVVVNNGNTGTIKTDKQMERVEIGKDTQFDLDM